MRSLLSSIRNALWPRRAFSSQDYWERRYRKGGDSGPGSYSHLAEFKAEVLNQFVQQQAIGSVIEFGCGDGNQLALANYRDYVGYDISRTAVEACQRRFGSDPEKQFFLASEYDGRRADLALSLDVIFHLTEDNIFEQYMRRLFAAASRYVIVYSSNQDEQVEQASVHVRHRQFTRWVGEQIAAEWSLLERIPNRYPYNGDFKTSSFADFYVYKKS
jgi:SAM-dependent methyltransferase